MGRKCEPCDQNKCERKYANRSVCQGRGWCTCTCQESQGATFWKSAGTIAGGVALVAGGVAATVLTGGVAAVVAGGAMVGAGASMVTNPVAKQISGERVTIGDLAKDVAVGSVVGVASGGIGMGGSALAKGATGVAKFGIRAGAGALSGAAGGAISESARAIQGEEVTPGSVAKSMGIGIVGGALGGASTHVASNASKAVTNGVGKAVTRVAIQTTTGAACAAGYELVETGEISGDGLKRIALAAGSQAAVATTYECTRNTLIKTEMYANKMGKQEVVNLHETIEGEKAKLQQYEKCMGQIADLEQHKTNLQNIGADPAMTPREIYDAKQQYVKDNNLPKNVGSINQKIQRLQNQAGKARPGQIGVRNNVHLLRGDRAGQIAVDLADGDQGRGRHRSVFTGQNGEYRYEGHTDCHNYDDLRKLGKYDYREGFDAIDANRKRKRKHEETQTKRSKVD